MPGELAKLRKVHQQAFYLSVRCSWSNREILNIVFEFESDCARASCIAFFSFFAIGPFQIRYLEVGFEKLKLDSVARLACSAPNNVLVW
jgi:hypothetical protein